MDVDDDAVAELFGEDRGTDISDADIDPFVSIWRSGDGYSVTVDGEVFSLSERDVTALVSELPGDTIWWLLAVDDPKQVLREQS